MKKKIYRDLFVRYFITKSHQDNNFQFIPVKTCIQDLFMIPEEEVYNVIRYFQKHQYLHTRYQQKEGYTYLERDYQEIAAKPYLKYTLHKYTLHKYTLHMFR